jgi:predicted dehydrogenase/NAD(P)-dependent dehydrogenase (short-subunit alcohol dehydrogenase family)
MKIVITGGTSGIGKMIAGELCKEHEVVVVSQPQEEVLSMEGKFQNKIKGYACDVSNFNEIEDTYKKIGQFDALITCAGILGPVKNLEASDINEWEKTIRVNLMGTVNSTKAAIPILKKSLDNPRQINPKIINIAGGGSAFPRIYHSAYAVSKAGVVRFAENIAKDFSYDRIAIDINVIAPGAYKTNIWKTETFDKEPEKWSDPGDLIKLVRFLLSERSNELSGKFLHIKDDYSSFDKSVSDKELFTLRRVDNFKFQEKIMPKELYNVGIIGCGFIGNKRANALKQFSNSKLVLVADTNKEAAEKLSREYNCRFTTDWKEITRDKEIDIVIIATTHNALSEITTDAIRNNKHILVEKPVGKNFDEIERIVKEYEHNKAKENPVKIKVGFNHRYHPAFEKAKEIIENEDIGEIMSIRAYYGHGGRLGYEQEWRAKKEIAGGGELLDQGSHLIDLSRYFLGDIETSIGYCNTMFWNMEVEDNCFAILRTGKNQIVQFHASWTHWKNSFAFDIFCKTGQISITGLGRSYGKEKLTFYRMKPDMTPPETIVYEFPEEDKSWEKEYSELLGSIKKDKEPNGNIYDALENMRIIEEIYKWDNENKKIC